MRLPVLRAGCPSNFLIRYHYHTMADIRPWCFTEHQRHSWPEKVSSGIQTGVFANSFNQVSNDERLPPDPGFGQLFEVARASLWITVYE